MPRNGSRITRTHQRSLVPAVGRALQDRDDRDDVEDRDDEPHQDARIRTWRPPYIAVSSFLRDRLLLREEIQVLAAAGLGVRAGHVEAAEGVHADERARALAVQVEVADEELALAAQRAARGRASRGRPSGRTRVSLATAMPSSKLLTLRTASTGPKISSQARRARRLDAVHDRRHDEVALLRPGLAAGDDPAFLLADRDVLEDLLLRARVDDGADGVLRVAHVADREGLRLRDDALEQVLVHASGGRSGASTPSTSGPGTRRPPRRCRWRRPRCRPSRRRG